jgi:microcystin-dependent protein
MSENYVGEIQVFAFNFAPRGWALCQGQLLPISQNTALFALLGVQYGGDGRSTFALPNLQGSVAIGVGQSPGLSQYDMGQVGGEAAVTLLSTQIPSHTHALPATNVSGKISAPSSGTVLGSAGTALSHKLAYGTSSNGSMAATVVQNGGGNQPHNNMAPYLTLNYCIALQGIFPPRN